MWEKLTELGCPKASGVRFKVHTAKELKVGVYDLKGSLVKAQTVPAGETAIGGVRPGAYLVELSDGTRGMVKVR